MREAVGPDFILIYRLSMLDLVPDGSTFAEVVTLARAVVSAGATIINTGIGWHEARIPTIATSVPRAAYAWVTKRLMGAVDVPLVTSNRINTPDKAEELLAGGYADMVSLARPFLADPNFVSKTANGSAHTINTCIGCNKACLDHSFAGKVTSCLVNPRACHETEIVLGPMWRTKRVAVVGAGPAGLAAATTAAERGHQVDLYDSADVIGGQLNVARQVPGKQEFDETLRSFRHRIDATGVALRLGATVAASDLLEYDEVVLATGVRPRTPDIAGVDALLSLLQLRAAALTTSQWAGRGSMGVIEPRARSTRRPACRQVLSRKRLPTSCTPCGRWEPSSPTGTARAGRPNRLTVTTSRCECQSASALSGPPRSKPTA